MTQQTLAAAVQQRIENLKPLQEKIQTAATDTGAKAEEFFEIVKKTVTQLADQARAIVENLLGGQQKKTTPTEEVPEAPVTSAPVEEASQEIQAAAARQAESTEEKAEKKTTSEVSPVKDAVTKEKPAPESSEETPA